MSKKTLAFATCNLYNLNLPGKNLYRDDDAWTEEQYRAKVRWTAAAMRRLPADVWGFQELWHAEALDAVLLEAGLSGTHEALAPPGHDGGRIACAAAVRKDFLVSSPEWIGSFPERFVLESGGDDEQSPSVAVRLDAFSRPPLRFAVRHPDAGEEISVTVVHFKSKRPADLYWEDWYKADRDYYKNHGEALGGALSTVRRTAEAAALRMMLTDETKGTDRATVVLGDCNDGQGSNTLNILTSQPRYLMGLSSGGGDTALYSAGTLQAYRSRRDVYYTHVHEGCRESLDHILVSQEFYDNSRKRIWAFDGMDLLNDHLDVGDRKADGCTDHAVVRARFFHCPA